jgi:hypothetical protein
MKDGKHFIAPVLLQNYGGQQHTAGFFGMETKPLLHLAVFRRVMGGVILKTPSLLIDSRQGFYHRITGTRVDLSDLSLPFRSRFCPAETGFSAR